MENPIDPKLIEDLKNASQEIEGLKEEAEPQISKIPKETPTEKIPGEAPKKPITYDLENHLSEIVEARKRLEGERSKIQSRLQLIINLENRIRRVLSERKKIDEDLGKMKNNGY